MAVVRELINRISYQTDQQSLNRAEQRTSKLKDKIKGLGKIAGAAILGIGALAIKSAADMEMMTTQFEVMLGSAEKAVAMMNELKKFAAATPFAIKDLVLGAQNLLSYDVAQEKVVDTMRMLADTAGGNAEKLRGLVLAYGKVQSSGKVGLESINQIAERGIPIISTLTKHLGVTRDEFWQLVSAGKLTAQNITDAFRIMTSEGGIFFKGAEKQARTTIGMFSTLRDNLIQALAGIGERLLPDIKDFMDKATKMIQGGLGGVLSNIISGVMPLVKTILDVIGGLMDALLPIISVLFSFLAPVLKILDVIIKTVMIFANALLGELGGALEQLAAMFVPILEEIAQTIADMAPIYTPILKIIAKFIGLFFKMKFIAHALLFKVLLKGFSLFLKILQPILTLLTKFLVPVLEFVFMVVEKIASFIEGVLTKVAEGAIKVLEFIFDIINGVITAINSIPFLKNKIKPLDSETVVKMIRGEQRAIDQKNATINQTNKFNISGMSDPEGVRSAVSQAVGTPFEIAIQQLIKESL